MSVLLDLVTVVGGFVCGTGDDVDDDGGGGSSGGGSQFQTFLMAGTAIAGGSLQRNVWRNNQN